MLRPQEDTYIPFLNVRRAPLATMEPVPELKPLKKQLTKFAIADRAVMEKGARAYVSYLKAYQEHLCKYVFVFDRLDLGQLATAMGLLRLPKVRELGRKRKRGKDSWVEFEPAAEVKDLDSVRYKDKQRERQRQAAKAKRAAEAAEPHEGARLKSKRGGSTAGQRLAKGVCGHELTPKEAAAAKAAAAAEATRNAVVDEDDFALETKLMKLLKKGKITKSEFHRRLGESDDED